MIDTAALSAYLDHIGLAQPPVITGGGLAQVQAAHRQNIPFENLDIPLGRKIAIDSDAVFTKLVTNRRGGYCFEQNRLFLDMLKALGFSARLLLARVELGDPPAPLARLHCLVLVHIAGKEWIADAGFGGAFAPPMPLVGDTVVKSADGGLHRLTRIGKDGELPGAWRLERKGPVAATDGRTASDSEWQRQYAFDLSQVADTDLALGNYWMSTHPDARFTNLTVASICLPDGFSSLVDTELSIYRAAKGQIKRSIETPGEYRATLAEQFGIDLSEAEIGRLRLFTPE